MKLLEDDTMLRGPNGVARAFPGSESCRLRGALALMEPSRQTVGDCACSIRLSPRDRWLPAMLVVSVNGGGRRYLLNPSLVREERFSLPATVQYRIIRLNFHRQAT